MSEIKAEIEQRADTRECKICGRQRAKSDVVVISDPGVDGNGCEYIAESYVCRKHESEPCYQEIFNAVKP